jgi:hypothetical protein
MGAGYLSGFETGAELPSGTATTVEKLDFVFEAIKKYCPTHPDEPIGSAVPKALEAAVAKTPM